MADDAPVAVTKHDLDEFGGVHDAQPSESDVSSMPGAVKEEWLDERGVRQWKVTVPLHHDDGTRTRAFGDVMDAQKPVVERQSERLAGRVDRTPTVEVVDRYGVRRRVDARLEDRLVDRRSDHYHWRAGGRRLTRDERSGMLWAVGSDGHWLPTGKFTVTGAPRWNGLPGRVEVAGVYHDPGGMPWMFDGDEWTYIGPEENVS